AREVERQDLAFAFAHDRFVRALLARERAIRALELALARAVHEEAVDGEAEVVARRAVHGPAARQMLVRREDLLDDDVELRLADRRDLRAQPLEIAARVVDPVRVVD